MELTLEQQQMRRVVCAAVRLPAGTMLCGARHYDSVMRAQMIAMGLTAPHHGKQGFIDQFGNFLSREEAWQLAAKQGQIVRLVGSQTSRDGDEELYSENLY
jgi:hypothetical protein